MRFLLPLLLAGCSVEMGIPAVYVAPESLETALGIWGGTGQSMDPDTPRDARMLRVLIVDSRDELKAWCAGARACVGAPYGYPLAIVHEDGDIPGDLVHEWGHYLEYLEHDTWDEHHCGAYFQALGEECKEGE